MVSGALQSLAGHDPRSISSEKAERLLTEKNRVRIEKTGKKRNRQGEGQEEGAVLAALLMFWVTG